MARTDKQIVDDWKDRLVFRIGLEEAAKDRHVVAQNALRKARLEDTHPRGHLIEARDEASAMLTMRRIQVADAKRVIARHQTGRHVHIPVEPILQHSNGFTRGHDGVDLITVASDEGLAICDGIIVDVRASGWWSKGAQASHGHPISDGDGIVQLQCTTNDGPFTKGMVFGYGHAEHAKVNIGDHVKAGQMICHAGFANAWHFHFMANHGKKRRAGGGFSGVGEFDPWPFIVHAMNH